MVAAPHAQIWLINALENTEMSFRAFRTMKSSSRPQTQNYIQHVILERFGTDVYRNSKMLDFPCKLGSLFLHWGSDIQDEMRHCHILKVGFSSHGKKKGMCFLPSTQNESKRKTINTIKQYQLDITMNKHTTHF